METEGDKLDRESLRRDVAAAAAQGVFLGTSSWKYPGWCGQLYDRDRYVWRGRFSEARFNKLCLAEYAEVFQTVCVDAAYYQFPTKRYLEELAGVVPSAFQFAFKVTDDITIRKFTKLPRFGARAGQVNENFLNADLFVEAFLEPCAAIRGQVGLLMFEFSKFNPSDFARGRDFVAALDAFLGRLPPGWPYGVEIRNRNFLHEDYFGMLARHGVTHVYNNWQDMPSVGEQMLIPGSRTTSDRLGARFLLTPGRKYQEAVDEFSPYDRVKRPDAEARRAGAKIIKKTGASGGQARGFVYVNNRLEGNALQTVRAMLDAAAGED